MGYNMKNSIGWGAVMKETLPVGVENFEDIVKSGYYHVDKTMFIKEISDL